MAVNRLLSCVLALACCGPAAAFDEDGVVYVSPAGSANNALGSTLALQPDGSFVVTGVSFVRGVADEPTLQLRRFDPDGAQDPAFAVSLQHAGTMSIARRGLLVEADGGVIVATTLTNPASPLDSYSRVLRFLPDGQPDPAFPAFEFDATSGADRLDVLAMQLDGRLLVAGSTPDAAGTGYDAIVSRRHPEGTLDTDFGTDGYVRVGPIDSSTFASTTYTWLSFTSIGLLADGRILLTGSAETSTGAGVELLFVRLLPDGAADPDFNGGEPIVYAHRNGNTVGARTTGGVSDVSPEGVFLVGASDTSTGSHRACLLQFDVDGSRMAEACRSLGDYDSISDVQLLPNGGAVGVGSFYDGGTTAGLLAIYDGGLAFGGDMSSRFRWASHGHSLAATTFDPTRQRLLSLGTGITQEAGLYSNRWVMASDTLAAAFDSAPDAIDAGPELKVPPAAVAGIDREIEGFDRFVRLPVRVGNGRVHIDGLTIASSADAHAALGFVTSFDDPARLALRIEHDAATTPGDITQTSVRIGGVVRSNNPSLTLGPVIEVLVTSRATEGGSTIRIFGNGFER